MSSSIFRGVVVVAAVGVMAPPALAQTDEAAVTRSRTLFKAGQEALAQKREAQACELFRESLESWRSPGTLLHVGNCFQREGDPLAALESYEDALRAAVDHPSATEGQRAAWIQEARRRMAVQNQLIGEVVIVAVKTPGLELTLDGKRVDVRWSSLRVNPGQHVLVARAPGYREHVARLQVAPSQRKEAVIPRLEPEAPAPPPPPPVEAPLPVDVPPASGEGSTPVLPWLLVGAGSASVAAGIVTGIITARKESELADACPNGDCPDASWQEQIDSAKRMALTTNVLWGVGLASAAVGVTLLLVEQPESAAAEAHLGCGGGFCGARLTGSF